MSNNLTTTPLVSVIVNCLNGERYLKKSLDSIYKQTYENFEIIFWNNGSTDQSKLIASSYDNKLKLYSSEDTVPLGMARNRAIREAKGLYIAFLDVDDWWTPEKLEIQIARFSDKDVGLVYGNYKVFNERKQQSYIATKILKTNDILTNNLLNNYNVGLITVMVRAKVFDKISFDSKYHIIGDFDFVQQ